MVAAPVAEKPAPQKVEEDNSLEARYARRLAQNQEKFKALRPQPHSNAYLTLNLEGSRSLTLNDRAIMEDFDQNLKIQRSKEFLPKDQKFHEYIHKALQDSNRFSKTDVAQKIG